MSTYHIAVVFELRLADLDALEDPRHLRWLQCSLAVLLSWRHAQTGLKSGKAQLSAMQGDADSPQQLKR